MKTEPSRMMAALNIAVIATWAVLAYVFHVADDLRLLVDGATLAWLGFAGEVVRNRVTPVA